MEPRVSDYAKIFLKMATFVRKVIISMEIKRERGHFTRRQDPNRVRWYIKKVELLLLPVMTVWEKSRRIAFSRAMHGRAGTAQGGWNIFLIRSLKQIIPQRKY